MNSAAELDFVVPVSMELDWPSQEEILTCIREQKQQYGIKKFALAFPCGGWRSSFKAPDEKYFREKAELFRSIKEELLPEGIHCGWWITLTIKSAPVPEWTRLVMQDGSDHKFANCPLDPCYRNWFVRMTALTAELAKPEFILTEDDFSLHFGCFCRRHLEEFSKREQKNWTREELVSALGSDKQLRQRWCRLKRDTLADFSAAIRKELDLHSPEIPMGCCQSGGWDSDGDATEAVASAMAGPNHRPFTRLYGCFYGGEDILSIPAVLFHPLWYKEHLPENFICWHETDTFPHTRFFSSAAGIRVMMSAVYSQGYDGSIIQTQQLLDDPNEEPAYGSMLARERPRFQAMHDAAKQCRLHGVHIPFRSEWLRSISHFGIPYTTRETSVSVLDGEAAVELTDEQLLRMFRKGLILDGDAAKVLTDRGFSEYMGVKAGPDAVSGQEQYDLGGREILQDGFALNSRGRDMHRPGFYAPRGNGRSFNLIPCGNCEILTRLVTFQKRELGIGMTRFVNRLGGKTVVMGMGTAGNRSSSLFNYRRQKLIQEQLIWCADEFAFVRNAPEIYVIMNRAMEPEQAGFRGMLTLTNLNPDPLEQVTVHLPEEWKNLRKLALLDAEGEWQEQSFTLSGSEMTLPFPLEFARPRCLLILS